METSFNCKILSCDRGRIAFGISINPLCLNSENLLNRFFVNNWELMINTLLIMMILTLFFDFIKHKACPKKITQEGKSKKITKLEEGY